MTLSLRRVGRAFHPCLQSPPLLNLETRWKVFSTKAVCRFKEICVDFLVLYSTNILFAITSIHSDDQKQKQWKRLKKQREDGAEITKYLYSGIRMLGIAINTVEPADQPLFPLQLHANEANGSVQGKMTH